MHHVTHNTVQVDHSFLVNGQGYAIKQDSLGRTSYFKLLTCTLGKYKGEPVWSRVIERIVPTAVKNFLLDEYS